MAYVLQDIDSGHTNHDTTDCRKTQRPGLKCHFLEDIFCPQDVIEPGSVAFNEISQGVTGQKGWLPWTQTSLRLRNQI